MALPMLLTLHVEEHIIVEAARSNIKSAELPGSMPPIQINFLQSKQLQEKLTNFGSLGLPSGPIPFALKRLSMKTFLA